MSAQIDLITRVGGQLSGTGMVANAMLQSGFNINALRTNTVLRKDEWLQLDNALIEVARKRLVAVGDLQARGLTYDIPNALGTTMLEWEKVSDMDPAEVSMSGVTEGENDALDFTLESMPLPIIHRGFNINIRKLAASRNTGQPLDTAQATLASRLVMEQAEAMVFVGHAIREGSARIYGLTTEPNRNTGSVTANWDTLATGEQMVDDILAMITSAQGDDMYGPYGIYVPNAAYLRMGDDYKANSDKTILQRLMEIPGLEFIKPSKDVPAGAVVLFQLSRDVIDEVMGLQPTMVQWESHGGMVSHFKVMAIMVPRVRSTYTGQSGVVHYS